MVEEIPARISEDINLIEFRPQARHVPLVVNMMALMTVLMIVMFLFSIDIYLKLFFFLGAVFSGYKIAWLIDVHRIYGIFIFTEGVAYYKRHVIWGWDLRILYQESIRSVRRVYPKLIWRIRMGFPTELLGAREILEVSLMNGKKEFIPIYGIPENKKPEMFFRRSLGYGSSRAQFVDVGESDSAYRRDE